MRIKEWTLFDWALIGFACYVGTTWLVLRILKASDNDISTTYDELKNRNERENHDS